MLITIKRALEESKRYRNVLKDFTTKFIALISKKIFPSSFNDFRRIALCNSIYKIFTKAIASRLAKVLPLIISEEQGGFVPRKDNL